MYFDDFQSVGISRPDFLQIQSSDQPASENIAPDANLAVYKTCVDILNSTDADFSAWLAPDYSHLKEKQITQEHLPPAEVGKKTVDDHPLLNSKVHLDKANVEHPPVQHAIAKEVPEQEFSVEEMHEEMVGGEQQILHSKVHLDKAKVEHPPVQHTIAKEVPEQEFSVEEEMHEEMVGGEQQILHSKVHLDKAKVEHPPVQHAIAKEVPAEELAAEEVEELSEEIVNESPKQEVGKLGKLIGTVNNIFNSMMEHFNHLSG